MIFTKTVTVGSAGTITCTADVTVLTDQRRAGISYSFNCSSSDTSYEIYLGDEGGWRYLFNPNGSHAYSFSRSYQADSDGNFTVDETFVVKKKSLFDTRIKIGEFDWNLSSSIPSIDTTEPILGDFSFTFAKRPQSNTSGSNYSHYYPSNLQFSITHTYNPSIMLKQDFLEYNPDENINTRHTDNLECECTTTMVSGKYKKMYRLTDQSYQITFMHQKPCDGTNFDIYIKVKLHNGTPEYTFKKTFKIPDVPHGVDIESLADFTSIGQSQTLRYNLVRCPYAVNNFDDASVTIESTNTASFRANGTTITCLASGRANINVISNSDTNARGSVSAYYFDGFPVFDDIVYFLDKNTVDKLLMACETLQAHISASGYSSVTFDGYKHNIFNIKSMLEAIASNIQKLAEASSSSADTDITFSQKNERENWFTAVNKMVTAINTMKQEQGL